MSRQVTVADSVVAALTGYGDQVEAMLRGELRCDTCTVEIGQTERVCVSVDVYDDPAASMRVHVTHPSCAPSRVRKVPVPWAEVAKKVEQTGGSSTRFVLGLLEQDPSGLVIWEQDTKAFLVDTPGAEPVDITFAGYLREGFTLLFSLEQLGSLSPALPGWSLELDEPQISVRAPDGTPALLADTQGAPPGWVEVVGAQRAVVAMVGAELGLDATNWERLDAAAQRGQLAAAVIRMDSRLRRSR